MLEQLIEGINAAMVRIDDLDDVDWRYGH